VIKTKIKTMKTKLAAFLFAIIFLAGCKVTLVPDNDMVIQQQITDAAKANDKIYLELLNAPLDKRSFRDYEKEYLEVELEINSIKLKNEARKNNKEMLEIVKLLHDHFVKYKDEHKARADKPLTDAMIKDYETDISAFWKALYFAEKNLPPPPTK
jgi:hypothetical protein